MRIYEKKKYVLLLFSKFFFCIFYFDSFCFVCYFLMLFCSIDNENLIDLFESGIFEWVANEGRGGGHRKI